METIILLLTFSLLLNLLLFRWGWSERRDRRVWQQEATVLRARFARPRRGHPDHGERESGPLVCPGRSAADVYF